jgi:hypothetical protein
MFFWHKRSTITLDCFTHLETIALNYPIARAGKFYPEELKAVPKSINKKMSSNPKSKITTEDLTIKSCAGLSELYSNGVILPAWDSFDIEMMGDNNYMINNPSNLVTGEHHHRSQYNNEIYKGYNHFKFFSPWFIRETTGIKFVWMHPLWNRSDNVENISILPAIVDYKSQVATHVNAFIKTGSLVSYKAGDPLVHMIPMSDKRIDIKIHTVDIIEWDKIKNKLMYHNNILNHAKLIIPDFLPKKKCPFGF